MARIRSIHPGYASDENFVQVSIAARLFFLLLLPECDDQGIFEWKPRTLKMRCFPADNIDIEKLLAELVSINAVWPYTVDGRNLGAVRNFRKYQRPKSPNAIYPITDEIRSYVGLGDDISEIADAQPPPASPKAEADGGGRREEGKKESSPASQARPPDDAQAAVDAWNAMAERAGLAKVQRLTSARTTQLAARMREAGGLPGIEAALAIVERSAFLTGRRPGGAGHEGWRCTFDFFLKQQSFTKIMEGQYDDREGAGAGAAILGGRARSNGIAAAAAELERRLEERDRRQPQPGAGDA